MVSRFMQATGYFPFFQAGNDVIPSCTCPVCVF